MFAMIMQTAESEKFSLHAAEEDAWRAGANMVVEQLKAGLHYGDDDIKPILDALVDGRWQEAIAIYNGFDWDQTRVFVSEEEIGELVAGPSTKDMQEMYAALTV